MNLHGSVEWQVQEYFSKGDVLCFSETGAKIDANYLHGVPFHIRCWYVSRDLIGLELAATS
jgi:hypothetical protein